MEYHCVKGTRTRVVMILFILLLMYYIIYLNLRSIQKDASDRINELELICVKKGNNNTVRITRDEFNLKPVPMIVHQFVRADTLTFRNYLSLLSIWEILKPYQIILYVRKDFTAKEFVYNDWYQKAIARIPALQIVKSDFLSRVDYSVIEELKFAISVLKEVGGVYVNSSTIVTSNLWPLFNSSFDAGITEDCSIGYLSLAQSSKPPRVLRTGDNDGLIPKCVSAKTFTGSEICCKITEEIYPYNIMWDDSSFGILSRTLFYGIPEFPKPSTSSPPIPKIVHYVWFGSGYMDYSMYLSFLSTQRFVKPLQIRIYVDRKDHTCPYLKKMAEFNNVAVVFYGPLKTIFQNPINAISHASDFLRADVLCRFGGIYIDWDVYWLKPIDDLVTSGYETISSLDYYAELFPRKQFPDTINMGVVLSRPGSRFMSLWRDSYKQYTTKHHTWNAVENVYKLYEEHPDLLVIDKRLQIMCHELRCHPLWLNDYKNFTAHHEFDFTKDVYAVHFTYPTPEACKSEKLTEVSEGYFADMCRHIQGNSSITSPVKL